MPWHIETDNAGCSGYAVVKDENGEIEGCHRTRGQAERQLAALYAAEPQAAEMDRALERIAGGDPLIVTDIDGTILAAGNRPIRSVIDEINSLDAEVYVLTGRDESRRAETEQALADAGLRYEELEMVGSQAAKKPQIDEWLAEYDIVAAYENDPEIRAYYQDKGVPLGRLSRIAEVEEILAELRAKRYS
jgi:hypothetical protein